MCLDFRELTPIEKASRMNQKLKANYEARLARLTPAQAYQKTSLVSKCVPALSGQWSDQGLISEGIDHEKKTSCIVTKYSDFCVGGTSLSWSIGTHSDWKGEVVTTDCNTPNLHYMTAMSVVEVGIPRVEPWNNRHRCTPKSSCDTAWYTVWPCKRVTTHTIYGDNACFPCENQHT